MIRANRGGIITVREANVNLKITVRRRRRSINTNAVRIFRGRLSLLRESGQTWAYFFHRSRPRKTKNEGKIVQSTHALKDDDIPSKIPLLL